MHADITKVLCKSSRRVTDSYLTIVSKMFAVNVCSVNDYGTAATFADRRTLLVLSLIHI